MTMTNRSVFLALFVSAPLLGGCPIDGDIGDAGDDANDSAEGDGNGDGVGDGADQGDGEEGEGEGEGEGDQGEGEAGDNGEGEAGEEGGESEGGEEGGEPCDTEEECGPAPGAPNFLCPDGVTVGGPGPCQELEGGGCGYPIVECPACCDPADEPLCFEGTTCCADGSWACNDGGGGSTCESGDGGVTCACCDPAEAEKLGCIEGASCCADGSWACNDGQGGSTCEQDGMECTGGACQDDGATCAGGESCCDGLQCCSGVPVPPGEEYCSAQCPISDRERKENFAEIDPNAVLDTLLKVPLSSWNYKFEDKSIRHVRPMAQDFKAAFEVGATDKAIYTIDADGVSFASIKALHGQIQGLRTENVELRKTLAAMQKRLNKLEKKK